MAKASPDAPRITSHRDVAHWGFRNRISSLQHCLLISNASHIKKTKVWKKPDIYKNTYFVLPPKAELSQLDRDNYAFTLESILLHRAKVDVPDFVKFFYELSDNHKERRLILNYICAIRVIEEIYDGMGVSGRDDMKVLLEMISSHTSIFRQLLVKEQHRDDPKKLEEIMSIFIEDVFSDPDDRHFKMRDLKMFSYFSTPLHDAISMLKKKCECSDCIRCSAKEIVDEFTLMYIKQVIFGFISLYMDWASFDVVKVEKQRKLNMESAVRKSVTKSGDLPTPNEGDQKRFMSKVAAQVPHWNKIDRAKILGMIENPGDGPMDFMRKLMEEVGMEKFKILALGKEYLCASCNRSSYIGEERLWACPRCHSECTRPMARYCDENCQTADWIKHESEFHSVDVCNICKKKAEPGKKLRRCGRCLKENVPNPAVYCDEVCQKQDWPKHKVAKHTKKGA